MEEKKKNNIVGIIITIIFVIIAFIGGWLLGNKMSTKETEEVETQEETKQKNEENLTEDDKYILTFLESTYTDEERLSLLNSTNCGTYIAKLFTNDLTNSEKLMISLTFFTGYHNADNGEDELIYEKYIYSEDPMILSKSTIEKIVTRYFAEYTYEPISEKLSLDGVNINSCDKDKCTIELEVWGNIGTDQYLTKVVSSESKEITLSTLYIVYKGEKSNSSNNYENYYDIYDCQNGTILKKEYKEQIPAGEGDVDTWYNQFFSQVEGKTKDYKFTFNDKKQLLKVEEL